MKTSSNDTVLSPQARARLGETLKSTLARGLQPMLANLFDSVDDTLFELAEHARDPNRQRDYFDGMRECRRRRQQVEESVIVAMRKSLEAAFRDDLRHVGLDVGSDGRVDDPLGLVEHEDLEEDLALQAMIGKCESQMAQLLYTLNQRVGHVLELPELDEADNPLGPASLAEAFRLAARHLDVPIHVRLVVFKLFERHVLGALAPLYKELGNILGDAGILPSLRPRLREVRIGSSAPSRRPNQAAEASEPVRQATSGHQSPETQAPAGPIGEDAALLARLIESIGSRRAVHALRQSLEHTSDEGGPDALAQLPAMAQRIPAATLQDVLEQLQHRSSPPPSPDRLKPLLLDQSHRLVGENDASLRPDDENVVDLVGMLFEQLQQDRRLPPTVQKLVSQLHVPVLRAALMDQNLLANGQHPARRLIEEIGSAAVGWSADADPGQRMLNRIRETVEWLRHSFDSDVSIFEQALRDFRAFSESQRRRAELAEQRATEAALGRERLLLARRCVADSLEQRIGGRPLSRWLGQLIARPWANYLALAWLRQGPESLAFGDALKLVEDMVLARQSLRGSQAQRMRRRLPEIESCLRTGLGTVAFHDSEIELICSQLRSYIALALGDEVETQIDQTLEPVPALFDTAVEELDEQPETSEVAEVAQTVAMLQTEGAGRWFELKREDGASERAKLAWISPMSTRCLLVNRQGLKVAEQRLESLAADLERGVAMMLEGGQMVQGALEGMLDALAEQAAASDLRAG